MADDRGARGDVLAESAGGDVAAGAVSFVGNVCGVFESGDCDAKLSEGCDVVGGSGSVVLLFCFFANFLFSLDFLVFVFVDFTIYIRNIIYSGFHFNDCGACSDY